MEQGVFYGQREEIVNDVEHDEICALTPDFGFVCSAILQQQRIEHLASIVAREDSLEPPANCGKRYVHDIGMLERLESQPQQDAHFL